MNKEIKIWFIYSVIILIIFTIGYGISIKIVCCSFVLGLFLGILQEIKDKL